jgi:hypothetical protein
MVFESRGMENEGGNHCGGMEWVLTVPFIGLGRRGAAAVRE